MPSRTYLIRFLTSTIASLLLALEVRAQPPETPAPLPTQWSGQYGGPRERVVRVLASAQAWNAAWAATGRAAPRPVVPEREWAIAIFLGERPTGGFGVEIVRTHLRGDEFIIEFRERRPAPDQIVTQALTTPWLIAVFPRAGRTVTVHQVAATGP